MRRSIAEHAQEMAVSWTTSSCTPYVGCQPTTRHKLGTATAKLHPREDPGRPAGRRGQGNHGGSPNVIDDDILIFARALKDQGTPIPQIATKLTITTGRTPQAFGNADGPERDAAPSSAGNARDCGSGPLACTSGYTFFRHDTQPRVTADPSGDPNTVYVVYDATKPNTEVPSTSTSTPHR